MTVKMRTVPYAHASDSAKEPFTRHALVQP